MNTANTVQVDLQDLAAVVQIIDVCSRRGAFEGAELAGIGALRSRFVAVLDANKPQETAAPSN